MGKINILAVLCLLPVLITALPKGVTRIPLHHKDVGREEISAKRYATICVGTPCQEFTILLDTGSSEFWIADNSCKKPCKYMNKFHSNKSSTFEASDETFKVGYAIGASTGKVGYDTVTLAGLTATRQKIGLAGTAKAMSHKDGTMGLGLKHADHSDNMLFFSSLVRQKKVREQVFTFCLSPADSKDPKNELILGGTDPERHPGKEFSFSKVIGTGKWFFNVTGISINGVYSLCKDGCKTIADTGNDFLSGNKEFIHHMNTAIGAEPEEDGIHYTIRNCKHLDRFPVITFTISGEDYVLHPKQYLNQKRGSCASLFKVTGLKNPTDYINLGAPFMTGKCSQFDYKNRRVGFVEIDD